MAERIREGLIKRIHVNQHVIRSNLKTGADDPTLTVKTSKNNFYGRNVQILGPAVLKQEMLNPLSCGARVFIETKAEVVVE